MFGCPAALLPPAPALHAWRAVGHATAAKQKQSHHITPEGAKPVLLGFCSSGGCLLFLRAARRCGLRKSLTASTKLPDSHPVQRGCSPKRTIEWEGRRTLPTRQVHRVAIIGGTHGNETTSLNVVQHLQRNLHLVRRPSFETTLLLANPHAVAANARYVEEDLNRCFLADELAAPLARNANVERRRARELDALLGPKNSMHPHCDFIIDLHNTTAAMGVALLIAPDDAFAQHLGYRVSQRIQQKQTLTGEPPHKGDVRIVTWANQKDWPMCPTVARSGMTLEVGPCSWGCIEPSFFRRTLDTVMSILDEVHAHNELISHQHHEMRKLVVPMYRNTGKSIRYPRDENGNLVAMVHPDLHFQDFRELRDGDNVFLTFSGDALQFRRSSFGIPKSTESVHAIFVNEAAYYEKDIAMVLAIYANEEIQALIKKEKTF